MPQNVRGATDEVFRRNQNRNSQLMSYLDANFGPYSGQYNPADHHRESSSDSYSFLVHQPPRNNYAASEVSGTIRSFKDTTSNSGSLQNTLTSQQTSKYQQYRQNITTGNDEIQQQTIAFGDDVPYAPYMDDDFADEIHQVSSYDSPVVNHAIMVQKNNPLTDDQTFGHLRTNQPMSANSPPPNYSSAASTLCRDDLCGPISSSFHHSIAHQDEPLPPSPSLLKNSTFNAQKHRVSNVFIPEATKMVHYHEIHAESSCWGKLHDRICEVLHYCGHEMVIATLVFLVELSITWPLFWALHPLWSGWFILPILDILLLSTIIISIFGFHANRPRLHIFYVVIHGIGSFLFIALAIFYLLCSNSGAFQSWADPGAEDFIERHEIFYSNLSVEYFKNLSSTIWFIVFGLIVCAINDIFICCDLALKSYGQTKYSKSFQPMPKGSQCILVDNSPPEHYLGNYIHHDNSASTLV